MNSADSRFPAMDLSLKPWGSASWASERDIARPCYYHPAVFFFFFLHEERKGGFCTLFDFFFFPVLYTDPRDPDKMNLMLEVCNAAPFVVDCR